MRKSIAVAKWVAVGSMFSLALVGCRRGPAPAEKDMVCRFQSVADGDKITYAFDLQPTTPDYELNVEVSVLDNNGEPIELESAQLQTRSSAQADFVDGPAATIDAGKVTFASTALPPSENEIRFSAKAKGLELTCTEIIKVRVGELDEDAPGVLSTRFVDDANQDRALNRAELTAPRLPNSAILEVKTQNIEDGQTVTVKDATSKLAYGTAVVSGGKADVTLTSLPNLIDADYTLVVEVSNQAGQKNQVSNPANPNYNAAAFTTLRIDLSVPTIALTCPSKTLFGLADDDDANKAGYQVKVCAQVSADTKTVKVKLGTAAEVLCTGSCIESGAAVVSLDVDATGTTTSTLLVTAVDASGNEQSDSDSLTLDFDPPTINITQPLASSGALSFWTNSFEADVAGAEGQSAYLFRKDPSTGVETALDDSTVIAGKVTWVGTFPQAGTYTLVAKVSDAAGNAAVPDEEPGIVVNSTGCSITIGFPALKPAYLTPKNDSNGSVAGIQTTLTATSLNCSNTDVTLTVDGGSAQTIATDGSGQVQFPVTFSSSGSFVVQVAISNGAVQPATTDSVTYVVDVTQPTLTFPQNSEVLRASSDLQRQTPGVQRLLAYTATVPTGARVDICSNQSPAPGGATACPDGALGWWVLQANASTSESAFTFPEGSYSIKPVTIWPGVGYNDGPSRAVVVDGIRPTVSQLVTFTNDSAPLNKLNVSELAASGGNPRIQVLTSEPATITVRAQSGATTFTTSSTATVANAATVTLNQNITASGQENYSVVVVLTDLNGNTNIITGPTTFDPLDTFAFVDFRADRVAPTCTITAPSKSQLGVADDAQPLVAGYQLAVAAATSTDVGTGGVNFTVTGGASPQSFAANATSGAAGHPFTVADTGTVTYNINAACTDESGNSSNATQLSNITVDNDVPTCTLTSPTTASGPYGVYSISTNVTVGGTNVNGLLAKISTKVGSAAKTSLGNLTVIGGLASGLITYPNGTQDIEVEVTDLAGNTCSNPERMQQAVVVNGVGCDITLSFPASSDFINQGDDTQPASASTVEFNVTGSSSNCNSGESVDIFLNGGATPLASGTLANDGTFNVAVSLPEGAADLEVRVDNGAVPPVFTYASANSLTVDLTPPLVGSVSPTGTVLYFVAASNENLSNSAYVPDTAAGAPANANVTISGVQNAIGGQVGVFYGSTLLASASVTSSPQDFTLPVELGQNTTGAFQVLIADAAGNVVTSTNANATVDVVAPSAPTVTPTILNARTASVNLSWAPTYDDASDVNSGAHLGYFIRWTYNALATSLGTETSAMSESDFLDASLVKTETTEPWSAGTVNRALTLPPLATYYIAVRAKDEIGNYSAFAAPAALSNQGTQSVFTNPTATSSQFFGLSMSSTGSVNNDSVADLAVAAQSAPNGGAVYLYYGGASFGSLSACSLPGCQQISPPDTVSQSFGSDVSMGNVGDIAGENKPDLIVGAPTFSSTTGRVMLYFGTNSGASIDPTQAIEFRGTTTGNGFGYTARPINDINGDGLMELLIAAPSETSGSLQGRVYIFRGRSRADWLTIRTGGGGTFVPTSSANWIIDGPATVTGGTQFGRERGGVASLGDVTGDGINDFSVPASKGSGTGLNSLYLYSGATVASAVGALNTGNAFQRLTYGTTASTLRSSFGRRAIGGINVYGAATKDLVVSHATDDQVYIFADPTTSFASSPSLTIQGPNTDFGAWFSIADLNGDGAQDLAIGENLSTNSSVRIIYQRAGSFDTTVGSGFNQSRSFGGTNSSRGVSTAIGDFDGDGDVDLAIGDDKLNSGVVTIWHP